MSGDPSTPQTPASRDAVHEALQRIARSQGSTRSSLSNGVSLHRMTESVSFTNLKSMLTAASGNEQNLYIGTVDGGLVVSMNFNRKARVVQSVPPHSKKRRRSPHEEAAEQAVERVKRGLGEGTNVDGKMLEAAKQAVQSLLASLRGAEGEVVTESYGLSFKCPEKLSAQPTGPLSRPRLILSARLAPGVAVPLKALFSALGPLCTQDGMMTVQDGSTLAAGFNLPLSDQAAAACVHGQKAISLFATVSES